MISTRGKWRFMSNYTLRTSQGDVVIIDTVIGIGHDMSFLYRGCNKMLIRGIKKNMLK